jgi:energy-coupling factor transporter ATP-binding protein EcfA2
MKIDRGWKVLKRGSVWRRWDLHVHTPGTAMADRFKGDWGGYLSAIEGQSDVAVIGVTDYMSISNYSRMRNEKANGRLANIDLLIPNIEFRATPETVRGRALNLHILVDPTDPDHERQILEALRRLTFTYNRKPFGCVPEDLTALGRAHDPSIRDDGAAERHGIGQFKVPFQAIQKWYREEHWLADHSLVAVSNSGTDGVGGLPLNDGFGALREEIIRSSRMIFSGNPRDRDFYLGVDKNVEAELQKLGGVKPCIHGSDAHELTRLFKPDQDRFCWIKADTTFEGLKQVLFEPADRVYIGAAPPDMHDESRVIDSVAIDDPSGWFGSVTLPLNPNIVAVIGQKGSGKSALAELISAAAGSSAPAKDASFLSKVERHLDNVTVTLRWKDGKQVTHRVGDGPYRGDAVRYLSQRFVERLCAEDHVGADLVQEVEGVVFAALDPTETLNATDFKELRTIKTGALRAERVRIATRVQQLIREGDQLRTRFGKLAELKTRVTTLQVEAASLKSQMPAALNDEDAKVQTALAATRAQLSALQAASGADKQRLVKIGDVRAAVASFTREMRQFYTMIMPKLQELGLDDEAQKRFEPRFMGDTDQPLAALERGTDESIRARQGDSEAPGPGTIIGVEAEINRLNGLLSADRAQRERIDGIQKRLAAIDVDIGRLREEIARIEGPEKERRRILPGERMDAYKTYFESLRQEQAILETLYGPIRQRLQTSRKQEQSLEFYIRWDVDVAGWIATGDALFDQRRGTPAGDLREAIKERLAPAWRSGDPEMIAEAMTKFIEPFNAAFLNGTAALRTGATVTDVLDWLFSADHIELTYGLRYNSTELEKLSPGTKGIVLLILYLGMDTYDSRPLIIDQPEENLDSESIYDLLVHYFRTAKRRRQIILITHNPNLVVNTDAEQVIVATCGRQSNGLPAITYTAGPLEDDRPTDGIRAKVCRILEGGESAFYDRERRYALAR